MLSLPIFGVMHHVAIPADQSVRTVTRERTRHVDLGGSPSHVPGPHDRNEPQDVLVTTSCIRPSLPMFLLRDEPASGESDFRSFRHGTNPSAWLCRIMSNTWINAYHKIRRRPPVTDGQPINCDRHASTGPRSAEIETLEAWPDNEKTELLEILPDHRRIVFCYNNIGHFRFNAIAEITDIPTGTVMPRLHRARQQLRTLLADVARERRPARGSAQGEAIDLSKPSRALGEKQ